MKNMPTKLEVSEFDRRINIGIKAQMGVRRLSNRALARQIERSEKYVRDRVNEDKEWAIADLERMCDIWNMTFGQITSYADVTPQQTELTDDDRRRLILEKLHHGGLGLAANIDPYKRDEMEGGDGR